MLDNETLEKARIKAIACLACALLIAAALIPWTFAAFAGSLNHADVANAPTDVSDKPAPDESDSSDDSSQADDETEEASDPALDDEDNAEAVDGPSDEEAAALDESEEDSGEAAEEAVEDSDADGETPSKKNVKAAADKPKAKTQAAAKAYAVLYNDGTLTFKYGDSDEEDVSECIVAPYTTFNPATSYGTSNTPWNSQKSRITSVVFDSSFVSVHPTSMANWFRGCTNLTGVTGLSNLDTSGVTSMNYMFYGCNNLASLDLSSFDTSNVTTMASMLPSGTSTKLSSITFGPSFNVPSNTNNRPTYPTVSSTRPYNGKWRNTSTGKKKATPN